MKIFRSSARLAAALSGFVLALAVHGKPPVSPREGKKSPSIPARVTLADETGAAALLRWLLLQNGGPDAASVGWPELIRVTTGKQVIPFDPANPTDARIAASLGSALDLILPQLNRPEGTLRSAKPRTSAEVAAHIAEDLRTALTRASSTTVTALSETPLSAESYPAFRFIDADSGKVCYFLVTIYSSGEREGTLRVLAYRAGESSKLITTDGCCLLIAIEHNGKAGAELNFLNWELIDLAKVSLRCAVGFDADGSALHQPGAVVTDGRKGRD